MVNPNSESESPFEEAVEYSLVKKGYKVHRQVGVAGYRIDLAILSEDGSKYDIGIECDGFTYHSTPAARDRDWLRQQVLEGLGWKLHRVWSTAWVRNPAAELDRIEAALHLARSETFDIKNIPVINQKQEETPDEPLDSHPVMDEISVVGSEELVLEDYQQANLSSFKPSTDLKDEETNVLLAIITQIARIEGPVHKDVVIERIRVCYQLGKVVSTTREKVEQAIRLAKKIKRVIGNEEFIWFEEEQLNRSVRYPVDGNIEHISPMELKSVTLMVAKVMFGIPQNDLITEIARLLKFNRTGVRIVEVLGKTIEDLIHKGFLVESFGMIHLRGTDDNTSNNSAVKTTNRMHENSDQKNSIKDSPSISKLVTRLKTRDLEVIDDRSSGGYLWIVGGQHLWSQLKPLKERDFYFTFEPGGDTVTQNRAAWIVKDNNCPGGDFST
jgi:very-short-patch-repair endonuclease